MASLIVILFSVAIIFLAGLTQGLAGFGFSLVAVPMLMVFYEPSLLIPIIIVHSTVINILLFSSCRKNARPRRIWPLMVAGAAGIPAGTYLLLIIDHQTLKLIVGVLIIIFGLAYLRNFRYAVKNERLASIPISIASGLLNGSISMSGPPVIFFFTNQGVPKRAFRADLYAYFMFINLVTLPVFLVSGLFTPGVIGTSMTLLPALVAGAFVGQSMTARIDDRSFRTLTLSLVVSAGAVSVISGMGWP